MTADAHLFERHIHRLTPIPTRVVPDLSRMQRFSAFLFDVYGTLIVSGAGEIGFNRNITEHENRLRDLLRRHGINQPPVRLADRLHRAIEKAHTLSHQKGIDYPEVDILQIWQQVLNKDDMSGLKDFALEYELISNPVYAMPGVEDLLLTCKKRHIPMGIVSNAQFYTVSVLQHILGATLEKRGFDPRLIFLSWREGHAKPSPVMFKRAKKVLLDMGIPAASVLMVGNDMRNDMLPARAAGFKTGLFAGDRRSLRQRKSVEGCKGLRPDLIITDLRQLSAGTTNP